MLTSTLVSILLCGFVSGDDFISLPMKRMLLPGRTIATRDGKSVSLKNIGNVAYSTVIHVGKHMRPFAVQVDTGSADLFIPSVKCKKCGRHQKFYCTKQSKYSLNLQYGLGFASGPTCMDQVTVGGLTSHNQAFIVAEEVDDFLQGYPFDGILGMAFREASVGYNVPVIHNILMKHSSHNKVFSFYLTNEEEAHSELHIGGSNPQLYRGNLSYVPVVGYEGHWEVPLQGFKLGDEDVSGCDIYPCKVVLDTGNTDISVPADPKIYFISIYAIIKKAIPSVKLETTTYFGGYEGNTLHIPDDEVVNLPPIEITIAGQKYTLDAEDYKGEASEVHENHRQIYLTTIPSNQWLFGDIFLRKAYTQYDLGNMRVGFAPVK